MRTTILIAAASLVLLSCMRVEQPKEEKNDLIDALKNEIDSLKEKSISKDSVINEFFSVLNEIEENLAVVRQKENIISRDAFQSRELRSDVRERINRYIKQINDLMVQNRQSLRSLNSMLKQSNIQIEEFDRRLNMAYQMIDERDSVILEMKSRLADKDFSINVLNATIDTLKWERERLKNEVKQQAEQINTAWYAFGTRSELLDNQIIDRTGGFLGIGRTYSLMDNFNNKYFTRIDITQEQSIPLFTSKATLLTTHPTDSYELVRNESGTIQSLAITDEQQFWSASRYLVILVN